MSRTDEEEPSCHEHSAEAIELVIRSRPRDLGGFSVRRVLPSLQRRMVGPFIFFDHMGPADMAAGTGIDVRPHPHIGLATVTYLFDGEIFHRDSLGSEQAIKPGDVNWMVAGRGIVHSERTRSELRRTGQRLHGIQAWVALPLEAEECEPAFYHHRENTLPVDQGPGYQARVIAGTAFGKTSPVRVASPTLYVDVALAANASFLVPAQHAERAVYVASGVVGCAGDTFEEGELLVLARGRELPLHALSNARLLLLGGAKLEGERFIDWNFVASSKDRIERAKQAWLEQRYPKVPGDEIEFTPLPGSRPPPPPVTGA
jgi:redox-sensitive bicupin YhaK (pirin superfamily)